MSGHLLPLQDAHVLRDPGLRRLGDRVVLTRELWLLIHEALRHQVRIAVVIDGLTRLVKALR